MNTVNVALLLETIGKVLNSSDKSIQEVPRRGHRRRIMSDTQVLATMVLFHYADSRNFKTFYLNRLQKEYGYYFPNTLSYSRFIERKCALVEQFKVILDKLKRKCTKVSYVDSTALQSCKLPRSYQHKTLCPIAKAGRTSVGWFYGQKLHLIINHLGEIISYEVTPGNVNDREPVKKKEVYAVLEGKLYGDCGYISQALTKCLKDSGIDLITKRAKIQKPLDLSPEDQYLLRRRTVIESVFNQLKNKFRIDHTQHRSVKGFLTNLYAGLIAYQLYDKKSKVKIPSLLEEKP